MRETMKIHDYWIDQCNEEKEKKNEKSKNGDYETAADNLKKKMKQSQEKACSNV